MAQDYASSIQGVACRVTRLQADGSLATGPNSAYVMQAFTRVSFTPEFEEGEDITEKSANGNICVSFKTNDTLKRVTLELAICEPDPEFTEIVAGGTLLAGAATTVNISNKALASNVATITTATAHGLAIGDSVVVAGVDSTFNGTYIVVAVPTATTFTYARTAADVASSAATGTAGRASTTGYAAPMTGTDSNPNGAGLEVWSKAISGGRQASTNPFWQWIFPYVQMRPTGERVIENGLLANTFSGWGQGNVKFGTGVPKHPNGVWPFTTDRAYAYSRVATAPTGTIGYQTVT